MIRRCCWAASWAATSGSGRNAMSSQGEIVVKGAGSSGVPNTRSAHIICVHVVPHLDGVLMTMSPVRNRKSFQRVLSVSPDR